MDQNNGSLDIKRFLSPLGHKWKLFGRALGISSEVLEQIELGCSEENRLTQVLIHRQRSELTLEQVITALEDNTVGEDGLALGIRMHQEFKQPENGQEPPTNQEPPTKRRRLDEKHNPTSYELSMFVRPDSAEKYCCFHCSLVPSRPHQAQCEHKIISCEACTLKQCSPECNFTRYKYDAKMADKVRHLKVHCPNKEYGCEKTIALSLLSDHLKQCQFQEIPCTYTVIGCSEMIRRRYMVDHTSTAGNNRHFPQAVEAITSLFQELKERQSSLVVPMHFKIGPVGKGKKKTLLKEGPVFYSHQNGYKLQLKIGIHVNRTTSQFNLILCSVPGENNGSLVWPVSGTLTVALLNQHKNQGHCTANIEFMIEACSQTPIFETRFQSPNDYITANGEGELQFCILKIELNDQCKPWLLDPSTINTGA